MHLVEALVKERVLHIVLPLLSILLVLAVTSVASSQQHNFLNFTVIRTPGSSDSFAFRAQKFGNANCSLKNHNICPTYGGIKTGTLCGTEELCCELCQCVKERSTFLVNKQRCVDDKNITENAGLSISGYRFNLDFPDSTCRSQALATLNTAAPGKQNFSICSASFSDTILRCTMSPNDSKQLDHNGRWVKLDLSTRQAVKHGFSMGALQVKWRGNVETILQGSILMLDVTCYEGYFSHTGLKEIPIHSRLLFKIAGSQVWQGSNVFQTFDIANPTNRSGGLVVIPTSNPISLAITSDSSTAENDNLKERLNVIQVQGKVDMILVVVAAVLGTLLFIAVIFACIGVAFMVMRKRKKFPLGASNPLYERGPDMTLAENRGSRNAILHNFHFYQPLVENTREIPRTQGEPIYQSLDEQVRVSKASFDGYEENLNRCSFTNCDMTADGYLIPTDGHAIPVPPASPVSRDETEDSYIDVLPDSIDTAADKSLNYKYDKPEEILSDHSPTMLPRQLPSDMDSDKESDYDDVKVVSQRPEQTKKRFYHTLEKPNEKNSEGEEKKLCVECRGTIGNYGSGVSSKPVRCLCDVTTKL